jgi:hypothetical protein
VKAPPGHTKLYTLNQRSGPAIHCYAHGEATYKLVRDTATALDGLERPSYLREDGEFDIEALKANREAAEAQSASADNSTDQTTTAIEAEPRLKIKPLKGVSWPDTQTSNSGHVTINSRSIANVEAAVRAAAGDLRYDEFTAKAVITAGDVSYPVDDDAVFRVWGELHQAGMRAELPFVRNAMEAIARRNRFDSGRDCFESLPPWDGVVRAESLFVDHFGADDTPYTREVAKLFFACLVRRGTGKAHKCDEMVVLLGPQGIGKSTIFKYLVGYDKFCENLTFGESNRDVLEKTLGKLVVEMSELSGISKTERNHMLNFISRTHDEGSLKYEKTAMNRARRFTFIGTLNPEKPIPNMLKEDRRFLILPVRKRADLMQVKREKLQILAEAVEIEKQYGPILELPHALRSEAAKMRGVVVARPPHEDSLEMAFGSLAGGYVQVADVYSYLGFKSEIEVGRFTRENGDAVGSFMASMGWMKQKPRKQGKQVRAFVKGTGPWYCAAWPRGPGTIAEIVEEAGSGGSTGMPGTVINAGSRFNQTR